MVTALIIQDDSTFRQSLKEGLCTRFPLMAVKEAEGGSEALEAMESTLPDLIFVDVRLQGENGFEVTRLIKSNYSQVPVVVLTDYDLAEYREAAHRSGADHLLVKTAWSWDEVTGLVTSLIMKTRPAKGTKSHQGKADEGRRR